MTTHTLFICKSCSADEVPDDCTDGNQLLLKLREAQQADPAYKNLNIEAVDCLWTCDRPCCASFVCPQKHTYHFVNLPLEDSASSLLKFSQLYRKSEDGYVIPAKMPKPIRSLLLVRIPPTPENNVS